MGAGDAADGASRCTNASADASVAGAGSGTRVAVAVADGVADGACARADGGVAGICSLTTAVCAADGIVAARTGAGAGVGVGEDGGKRNAAL